MYQHKIMDIMRKMVPGDVIAYCIDGYVYEIKKKIPSSIRGKTYHFAVIDEVGYTEKPKNKNNWFYKIFLSDKKTQCR